MNVDRLAQKFTNGSEVTPESLIDRGIIKGRLENAGVKILGRGELTKKLTVKAHKFSRKAKEKIVAQGGEAIKLE